MFRIYKCYPHRLYLYNLIKDKFNLKVVLSNRTMLLIPLTLHFMYIAAKYTFQIQTSRITIFLILMC